MEGGRRQPDGASQLGPNAASAEQAPAANSFKYREQTRDYKDQTQPPKNIAGDDDAGDKHNRAHHAAREPA